MGSARSGSEAPAVLVVRSSSQAGWNERTCRKDPGSERGFRQHNSAGGRHPGSLEGHMPFSQVTPRNLTDRSPPC